MRKRIEPGRWGMHGWTGKGQSDAEQGGEERKGTRKSRRCIGE